MDWNRIEGNWKQFGGRVKEKWGKLTDDDIDQIQGDGEKFLGKLQERYGYGRERAEQELNDFLRLPDDQRRRRTA